MFGGDGNDWITHGADATCGLGLLWLPQRMGVGWQARACCKDLDSLRGTFDADEEARERDGARFGNQVQAKFSSRSEKETGARLNGSRWVVMGVPASAGI